MLKEEKLMKIIQLGKCIDCVRVSSIQRYTCYHINYSTNYFKPTGEIDVSVY